MSPESYDVACQAAGTAIDAVEQVVSGKLSACLVPDPSAGPSRPAGRADGILPVQQCGGCGPPCGQSPGSVARADRRLGRAPRQRDTGCVLRGWNRSISFRRIGLRFIREPALADETGTGPGLGTIFNLPLRFGISRHEFRERFHNMLERAAARAKPELILISAGFDAHRADPIGSLGLESEDFRDLTRLVLDCADQYCGGKIVSLLEGGYNLQGIGRIGARPMSKS